MSIFGRRSRKPEFDKYPCNDYLNNALRMLLDDSLGKELAIDEVCYCIAKGGGYIFDDVLDLIKVKQPKLYSRVKYLRRDK